MYDPSWWIDANNSPHVCYFYLIGRHPSSKAVVVAPSRGTHRIECCPGGLFNPTASIITVGLKGNLSRARKSLIRHGWASPLLRVVRESLSFLSLTSALNSPELWAFKPVGLYEPHGLVWSNLDLRSFLIMPFGFEPQIAEAYNWGLILW